jgi:hypothetical protein
MMDLASDSHGRGSVSASKDPDITEMVFRPGVKERPGWPALFLEQ